MANVYRKVLEDTKTVTLPTPASTAIEIGDLCYWDDSANDVKPASSQADQGTEATNQIEFANKFLGVAAQQRLATETNTGENSKRVFDCTGVYDFPCPSTTWEVGDLVGGSENGAGNALLDQQVEKVTDRSNAIGICVARTTGAVTTVRCALFSKWAYDLAHHRAVEGDEPTLADDGVLSFGAADDAQQLWSTGDASNHSFVVALGDTNQALHLTDKGAKATDWNVSADTHPTLYVHSNTTPATDYMKIGAHDGSGAWAADMVGGAALYLGFDGLEALELAETASAVNHPIITNAATGVAPSIKSTGTDTHVTLEIGVKGTTSVVQFTGPTVDKRTQTATTDTATLTIAQLLTKVLDATPTAAAAYTLPTAADLVAGITNAKVGNSFEFLINNKSAGANTITVGAGAGGTADGTLTVAQHVIRRFTVILTNVTGAAEAYFVYGEGA